MALIDTWNFFASVLKKSPLAMVYSVAPAGGGVGLTSGGVGNAGVLGVTAALLGDGVGLVEATGGLVGSTNAGVALVGSGATGGVSGGFWHPCISKATKPMPWMARTTNTAIFTRARPLFFCSRRETFGTIGLGLFIFKWRLSVCLLRCCFGFNSFRYGLFPQKTPEQILLCFRLRFTVVPSLFYCL